MTPSRLRALALYSLTAGLLGAAAQAQPAFPPPSSENGYGQRPGYGQPPTPQQIASDLRHRLLLRPDQEGALQDFVRGVTPPPGYQQKMYEQQQEMRTMTTPQRLDVMVSNLDEMRRMMLARAQVTKAFYATLTPDQQRAFDQLGANGAGGGAGPGG
jgi:hypothetical protein